MIDFVAELARLIGSPPPGFEFLQYAAVIVIFSLILSSCITFVSGLLHLIGGR